MIMLDSYVMKLFPGRLFSCMSHGKYIRWKGFLQGLERREIEQHYCKVATSRDIGWVGYYSVISGSGWKCNSCVLLWMEEDLRCKYINIAHYISVKL